MDCIHLKRVPVSREYSVCEWIEAASTREKAVVKSSREMHVFAVQKSECETRTDSQFVMCKNEMMKNVNMNMNMNVNVNVNVSGEMIIQLLLLFYL